MKAILTALVAIAMLTGAGPATAETITFASWNIANLHHQTGVPLRNGATARQDADYQRLSEIGKSLGADIVALQEIGSPAALQRVFPAADYHLVMSDLYQPGDENKPPEQRDIYTALAISKSRFPNAPRVESIDALAIDHISIEDGRSFTSRPTRSGMQVEIELGGKKISFLGVHLKSSCHDYPLRDVEDQNFFNGRPFASRFDCRTLKAQLGVLENWIEAKQGLGFQVIIAGDFNRRLNAVYRNPTRPEDFWAELNDGTPNGLQLIKGPEGLDTVCWPQHTERFDEHIDFIVADAAIKSAFPDVRFRKLGLGHDTDPEYADEARQRLSDHCPVTMTLSN